MNMIVQTYRVRLCFLHGMGSDATEVIEVLPKLRNIKVHRSMCTKLIHLVEKIIKIFPDIEAYRPRCSSGIQALCSLRNGIEKAKLLLQSCCEDSKLYLAIKGEATLLRCKNTGTLLEQSLSYIQNNVPVILAAEISPIISDLRGVTFSFDSVEEEAGKAMRTFLKKYTSSNDSMETNAIETLRFAFVSLQITSQRALLTERRSVKKLLDNLSKDDSSKKNLLVSILVLLKEHGKIVVNELSESSNLNSFSLSNSCDISPDMQSHFECVPNGGRNDNVLHRSLPPEEYKCPISLTLMYDPVIISSGVTFERMWIEKWFSEGHDICPKTKTNLKNLSLTPNIAMKDLISKWCVVNGVLIPNPRTESTEAQLWDTSLTSIASLGNSMNYLQLPVDFSQMSVGSLNSSNSVLLRVKDSLNSGIIKNEDKSQAFRDYQKKYMVFDMLDELSWECQCESVEDMKEQLRHDNEDFHSVCTENFVGSLIRFMKNALDRHEEKAMRAGSQLLTVFISKCRNAPDLPEEAYSTLASVLESEVTMEALALLELLSHHLCYRSQILRSGALYPILQILKGQAIDFLELAMKIINNLSLSPEICCFLVPSMFIPELVSLIEDDTVSRYCISILKNLCQNKDTRVAVSETSGCIASIAKLLESDNDEVQEHAVIVLLSLCSERVAYCRMVMKEGVIPPLFFLSQNGNEKGKASAMELLRLLRDVVDVEDTQVLSGTELDSSNDSFDQCEEKNSPSKKSRKFGFKFSIFSKHSISATKTKK